MSQKTYCRIIDYLRDHHPEVHEVLLSTCAEMSLISRRNRSGVTFLVPTGDHLKQIRKLAFSSNPDDAGRACDMLNALSLRNVYKSAADFMSDRQNIANSLNPYQQVELEKASGTAVTFASGASASLDKDFIDASRDRNLAVWILKGEIPVTTDRPAQIKKKVKGGYSQSVATELSKKLRWRIAVAVEAEYSMKRMTGASGDPFVRSAMSLVEYLHENGHHEILHGRVMPLLSISKADFYLITEPHRSAGEYLIPDSFIEEWWNKRASHGAARGCTIVDEHFAASSEKEKSEQVLREVAKLRESLIAEIESRPRDAVKAVQQVYEEFSQTNRVGAVENVLPQQTAAMYASDHHLKMLQDELRFLIHCAFHDLESREFDSGRFSEITNMVAEYMHKMAGTEKDIQSGRKLLSQAAMRYSIQPSDHAQDIIAFVNSTCFMHVPMCREVAETLPKSRTQYSETKLWNIAKDNYETHERTVRGNETLEKLLAEVAPELAEQIRNAVSQ